MFYTYVPNTIKTRKRTTPAQLEILEGVFLTDKKPNAPRRKELAKKLKMSPREVQVWFQNRRAKEKK
ncbi:homeobox domain-containing protein, partial [Russula compacta]